MSMNMILYRVIGYIHEDQGTIFQQYYYSEYKEAKRKLKQLKGFRLEKVHIIPKKITIDLDYRS